MAFSTDPVFPAPAGPPPVEAKEAFVAPLHLGASDARSALDREIGGRFAAPADALLASEREAPRLLWMPFWRIQLALDGFDVQLGSIGVGPSYRNRAPVQIPVPWVRSRNKEAAMMVRARAAFGYQARVPSWWGRNVSGTPVLELGMEEVAARGDAPLDGEVVVADISEADAVRNARRLLEEAVRPSGAIYADYQAKVVAASFVLYPLYFARYRYRGEARGSSVEDCFVAVSGRTGKPVAAKHPSALRSAANKLRRLFSFS